MEDFVRNIKTIETIRASVIKIQNEWLEIIDQTKVKSIEVDSIEKKIGESNSYIRSFFNEMLANMQSALVRQSKQQKLDIDELKSLKEQKSNREVLISQYINYLEEFFRDLKLDFEKCKPTGNFGFFLRQLTLIHFSNRELVLSKLRELYGNLNEICVKLRDQEALAAERDTCLGKCLYYSDAPSKWTHKSLKEHLVYFPAPVMLSFKGFHNIQDQIDKNKQSEDLEKLFSSKKPGHFEEKEQPTELEKLEEVSRKFINEVKDAQIGLYDGKSGTYEAKVCNYLDECFVQKMKFDYAPLSKSKLKTTDYQQAQMLPPATPSPAKPSAKKRKRDPTSESSESSIKGGGTLPQSDGCMKSTNGNFILHLEVKTLFSDKIDQLFGYYALYTAEKKEECPKNPFPALLFFVNGNIVSVYGAIFTHCISISPVIQPIDVFHKNAVRDLIATMKTLKDVLGQLESYYDDEVNFKKADYIDWSDNIFKDPITTAKISKTKTKEDYMNLDSALPIFWECEYEKKDAILKFTSHYNKEAHEALADKQFAPKLHYYEENHIYCVVLH